MTFGDFKDFAKRTASDKILRYKVFNIAKIPKYNEYQRGLASIVYDFFDKKTSGGAATLARSETLATRNKSAVKNENMSNKELLEELHKLIIRKFEKRKVYSYFIGNICGADIASISKNVHIDKLDAIFNKYNNTYHKTIKIKPVDVKPSMYVDFNKENNKESLEFKVVDNVRISK